MSDNELMGISQSALSNRTIRSLALAVVNSVTREDDPDCGDCAVVSASALGALELALKDGVRP